MPPDDDKVDARLMQYHLYAAFYFDDRAVFYCIRIFVLLFNFVVSLINVLMAGGLYDILS